MGRGEANESRGDGERRNDEHAAAGDTSHGGNLRGKRRSWTAADAEAVAAQLPELAGTLFPILTKRGLTADEAADVVQEVLARAWANRGRFRSARALYRWAYVVARNLATTHQAQKGRVAYVDPPDRESADVAELADLRWELGSVLEAWRTLSAADREVIATALQLSASPEARSVRGRKRLERARQRLRQLMQRGFVIVAPLTRVREDNVASATALAGLGAALVFGFTVSSPPSAAGTSEQGTHFAVVAGAATSTVGAFAADTPAEGESREPGEGKLRSLTPGSPGKEVAGPAARPWTLELPWAADHRRVDTRPAAPAQVGVEAQTREKRPHDPFVCVQNVPALASVCVDHLIR